MWNSKKLKIYIMKKFILVLTLFVGAQVSVMAQNPLGLKGPEAKNYKPWKHQAKDNVMLVNIPSEKKQGPANKNAKNWKSDINTQFLDVDLEYRERETGPKGKNRKVWRQN